MTRLGPENVKHAFSDCGDDLLRKPLVFLQPDIIARRGMRKRDVFREILTPGANGLRGILLLPRAEISVLRVLADEQSELAMGK